MEQKQYYVYLFTFPNGKCYCGYSGNISKRWSGKGNRYEKCPLVYKAIQKYGWDNINKEIIFSSKDQDEALEVEKAVIEELDLLNSDKGYNLVEGGGALPHGSQFLTEEGRKKLQENGKRLAHEVWDNPEKRAYAIQRMKEETHKKRMLMSKEELKEKYGQHNIGRTPVNARSIYQLDKDTEQILNEYNSSYAAAEALGNKSYAGNIRSCAGGSKKTAYGYKWRWKDENSSS